MNEIFRLGFIHQLNCYFGLLLNIWKEVGTQANYPEASCLHFRLTGFESILANYLEASLINYLPTFYIYLNFKLGSGNWKLPSKSSRTTDFNDDSENMKLPT